MAWIRLRQAGNRHTKLIVLTLILFGTALAAGPHKPQAIVTLYVAPKMRFSVEGGTVKPGSILNCKAATETHPYGDHKDDVLLFTCEGGVRLAMNGVYFGDSNFAIRVDSIQ